MTKTTRPRRDFLFCEPCNIKTRTHHQECPRCGGDLVDGREHEDAVASVRKEEQIAREVRLPAVVGIAAVVLAVGGITYGLIKGASVPPIEPVSLGRVISRPPAKPKNTPPSKAIDLPQASADEEGLLAFAEEDFRKALDIYEQRLREFPDDLTALNNAAQALVRLGRPAEAIPLLERAVSVSPQSWMARFNLARAFGEAGVWSRAVGQYVRADELMPGHYPTLFNLGLALQETGRDSAATDVLSRAAKADPTQADPWLALGVSYDRLGLNDDAGEAFAQYLGRAAEDAPERAMVERRLSDGEMGSG